MKNQLTISRMLFWIILILPLAGWIIDGLAGAKDLRSQRYFEEIALILMYTVVYWIAKRNDQNFFQNTDRYIALACFFTVIIFSCAFILWLS